MTTSAAPAEMTTTAPKSSYTKSIDEQIAAGIPLDNIKTIGAKLGLSEEEILPYGHHKAKIQLLGDKSRPRKGKLILVG